MQRGFTQRRNACARHHWRRSISVRGRFPKILLFCHTLVYSYCAIAYCPTLHGVRTLIIPGKDFSGGLHLADPLLTPFLTTALATFADDYFSFPLTTISLFNKLSIGLPASVINALFPTTLPNQPSFPQSTDINQLKLFFSSRLIVTATSRRANLNEQPRKRDATPRRGHYTTESLFTTQTWITSPISSATGCHPRRHLQCKRSLGRTNTSAQAFQSGTTRPALHDDTCFDTQEEQDDGTNALGCT